ncbi:MAG: hypothetical protein LBQ74_12925 [Prevotella sp.]|jgi:hypothetical protein|nr:hypothetical protein [Prevotella sp.]
MKLTKKQTIAYDYFTEPKYANISEILYGGAAGGGKTRLGVGCIAIQALKYDGTRWVIGRDTLKTLKETTLKSFFDFAKDEHITYRYVENKGILLPNSSEILLKDLAYYPSDPNYDELGSLEITGAFVDECNQITQRCWQVLKSRIRYKLDEYGLTPKMLGTCNPARNWVYDDFYLPCKENRLEPHRIFIPALIKDNPYISKHYEENLMALDEVSRERLLAGNWDYLDITDLWAFSFRHHKHVGKCELNPSETVYLSFDFNRNPIVCSVYQHYDNTIYCLEVIDIDDSTIYRLCDEILQRYPGCFFVVTGDVSGKSLTTMSQLNNFDVIKISLDLSRGQMQYSGANPPLAESRQLVNAMLEQYNIIIDEDKCKPLIYDLMNVKSDKEGKPVKNDRKDPSQRADCLDTFRYYLNRFFRDYLKFLAIK